MYDGIKRILEAHLLTFHLTHCQVLFVYIYIYIYPFDIVSYIPYLIVYAAAAVALNVNDRFKRGCMCGERAC